jgi:hypothetical protein
LPAAHAEVLNMRVQSADEIVSGLFRDAATPTSSTSQNPPAAAAEPAATGPGSGAAASDPS